MSNGRQTLSIEKTTGVAILTLTRPERLNAYSVEMRDELWECLDWLAVDADVRACVFNGAGRAFCSGADLAEFGTAPSVVLARQVRTNRAVWTKIMDLPLVTIAALHGYVLGAGLEIALACDLRFIAHGALLGMPETGLGFVPPAGGTQLLPRTVGVGRAKRMLYTRAHLSAEDAVKAGIGSRLCRDREHALDEALQVARAVAGLDPDTTANVKRSLRLA